MKDSKTLTIDLILSIALEDFLSALCMLCIVSRLFYSFIFHIDFCCVILLLNILKISRNSLNADTREQQDSNEHEKVFN